jgi:hypothetical protein
MLKALLVRSTMVCFVSPAKHQCRKKIRHFIQVIVSQVMACCQRLNRNSSVDAKEFEGGYTWEMWVLDQRQAKNFNIYRA